MPWRYCRAQCLRSRRRRHRRRIIAFRPPHTQAYRARATLLTPLSVQLQLRPRKATVRLAMWLLLAVRRLRRRLRRRPPRQELRTCTAGVLRE